MVAEWSRAPANSSREEGDVGSSPSPAKITFSDEIFLNNSRVCPLEADELGLKLFQMKLVLKKPSFQINGILRSLKSFNFSSCRMLFYDTIVKM